MLHRLSPPAIRNGLFAVVAALFLSACVNTSKVDDWSEAKGTFEAPGRVAVMAVLPDALLRKAFERDVAKLLTDKGISAIAASNIKGLSGGIRGEIDTEVAVGHLRKGNVDGIIVMFYRAGEYSEGYVRSDYWAENVGTGFGYWGRPYMTDVYTIRQGPGWADYRTIVYVESSYYDLASEKPAWRIVTKTKDLEHSDAALEIGKIVASEMRSAGLK